MPSHIYIYRGFHRQYEDRVPGMRPAPIYSGSRRIGCSVKKWLVKASVVALYIYIDGDWGAWVEAY